MPSPSAAIVPADLRALLEALPEVYAQHDLAVFPQASLRILRRLIPTIFSTYNELNLRTGAVVVVFDPEKAAEKCRTVLPHISRLASQHPLLSQYQTTGAGDAQTISDFVGWEEWQQREIYREAFIPIGVGDSLSFAVQSTTFTQIFFVLNRERPTFTQREREICNLLRPHLAQAFENAQAFTEAHAFAALAAGAVSELRHGLIIADRAGNVRHANDLAIELLDRFLPSPRQVPRRVPEPMAEWMSQQHANGLHPHCPLQIANGGSTLVVRFAAREEGCLLLLSERGSEPDACRLEKLGLTPREAEVLYWVTQGKANSQVAEILGISPRTVDKHLENLFGKLGVEARGAAMCLAAGVLGGSA